MAAAGIALRINGAWVAIIGALPNPVVNKPPTAAFTPSVSTRTVAVDGSLSSDPDGTITAWQWDFGDGSKVQEGETLTHTYSADGSYRISLTVTDDKGLTGSTTKTVTVKAPVSPPSGGSPNLGPGRAAVPVWSLKQSDVFMTSDQESRLVQYNDPIYGYKAGDTLQATLDRLIGHYGTGRILEVPNGFDLAESNITLNSSGAGYGAYKLGLIGLFCAGGPTQARILWRAGLLSASEIAATNSAGYENNGVLRIGSSSLPLFIAGLTLEMEAQAGLSRFNGFYPETVISGSRMHNMRMIGLGYGNNSSPPGETGIVRDHLPVGMTISNCEFDGRSRSSVAAGVGSGKFGNTTDVDWDTFGARHTGMYLVNGARNITFDTCDFHDSKVSSLTFSFTSYPSKGSSTGFTQDVTTKDIRVSYDANEAGAPSGMQFTGINHEECHGTITHNNPTVVLNPAGQRGSYSHFNWEGANPTDTGVAAGQLVVKGGTFRGGPSGLPTGMPVVRTYSWGPISSKGYAAHMYTENEPIFYNNAGVRMKMYPTVSAAVSAGATKDTGFVWFH